MKIDGVAGSSKECRDAHWGVSDLALLAAVGGVALGRLIQYLMSEYSLTFSSRWWVVTWRTVPDFDRITSDSVVAP